MRKIIGAFAVLLMFQMAQAAEVAGVTFDDKASVGSGELAVNGVGLRKKAFFKIYAIALYLPEKQSDANAVLVARGGKRLAIRLLRDLSAQQFVDALNEGLVANHSDAELAQLKPRIQRFSEAMLSIGEARSGTRIDLDWLPGSGVRLSVGGQVRGNPIEGEDFYRALLRIWLGDKPVQADLKQALLGKEY